MTVEFFECRIHYSAVEDYASNKLWCVCLGWYQKMAPLCWNTSFQSNIAHFLSTVHSVGWCHSFRALVLVSEYAYWRALNLQRSVTNFVCVCVWCVCVCAVWGSEDVCVQCQAARTCVCTSLTWRDKRGRVSTHCRATRHRYWTCASTTTRVCWLRVTPVALSSSGGGTWSLNWQLPMFYTPPFWVTVRGLVHTSTWCMVPRTTAAAGGVSSQWRLWWITRNSVQELFYTWLLWLLLRCLLCCYTNTCLLSCSVVRAVSC